MTNDLLQRARDFDCIGHYATSWHDRVEVECDSGCLSQFAAAEIARREAEIADEIFLDVLKFNNDERHEHQPDPCLVCDILDATGKIWEKLQGNETESLGRIVDKLRAKL